ncbi:hypothetical protein [Pedobacter zeae]|uniref:Uncharacterized protein n=1 Tax=Pedobacter zeae TaxID=1737356 RepID=A0A7W6KCK8_9SPHI|nr:hypothetical protein [Pedobacter zeae]MBB4109303.1 hypothetical protein [Pedobacter zeae]GGH19868.1 hypothetical protein GCM10007422_45000 [Pedobacter zeae]
MKQPYYIIDFSASACLFEIRVNDYPVIHMNVEGQVASNIPINYAILKSGIQFISVTILPNLGDLELHPKSEVKFNIKLFDCTSDFVFDQQFGEYQSEIVGEKKIPVLKYVNSFKAEVPYQLEAWQKGKNLKNIKDCREKLELAYRKVIRMIMDGRFDDYNKLISKREENMAISMYLSKGESNARVAELIADFKSGFKISNIPKDSLMFLCADNKVAFLKKLNGESALCLENNETQEELMLDISFYIPEGKEEFEVI